MSDLEMPEPDELGELAVPEPPDDEVGRVLAEWDWREKRVLP
ncbi:hypothetical protein KBTX_02466 [wastewater metagenome]|uniref:Uncharacterized protein n=2 Tax=unclassified sequences TaxID=12908 RepID=A0A5B8RBR3_9ZZZZ|nr:hypothetical protein [Arhodomonas sp. KWT]QEA06136.1 hypothetical protein KBTEX_02466 [uncultured organism]